MFEEYTHNITRKRKANEKYTGGKRSGEEAKETVLPENEALDKKEVEREEESGSGKKKKEEKENRTDRTSAYNSDCREKGNQAIVEHTQEVIWDT